MNWTNYNAELPPLKARCNQMGVHIPARNPTPAQIIPYVEARLADHQKNFAKNMDPSSGYYREWKSLNDDLTNFLKELGATQPKTMPPIPPAAPPLPTHQNNFSPQNPPQSGSTLEHQRSTAKSEVGSGGFKPTSSESNPPKKSSPPAQSNAAAQDEPFDIRQHLDDASMRVCEDLQEYLSGRSPIDDLTPQQQGLILLLLEDHTAARVAEVVGQPEPYGFNLKTSESSLNRFRQRIEDAEKKRHADIQKQLTDDLLALAAESDDSFQTVIQRLLKKRLILSTNNPLFSPQTIDCLMTSYTKFRKQTLAERKQLHAEKTK